MIQNDKFFWLPNHESVSIYLVATAKNNIKIIRENIKLMAMKLISRLLHNRGESVPSGTIYIFKII